MMEDKFYKSIFRESTSIMLVIEPESGNIVDANLTALRFYGFTHSEITQMRIQDINQLTEAEVQLEMQQAAYQNRNYFRFIHKKKSGELVDVDVYSGPIRSGDNTYLFSIIHDTGDIKKIEEENKELLESSMEKIGILAGGIAHDYNNVFTSILGNIELLKLVMKSKDETVNSIISDLSQAVERAKNLSSELLTFSHGGNRIMEYCDIVPIIKSATDFAVRGSKVSVDYNFQITSKLIRIDKFQISRVITNIVINAKEAIQKGEIKVTVGERQVNHHDYLRDGKYLTIQIKDDGPGISEEVRKKIFVPYFSTKSGGRGLGLVTSMSVIKRHGGFIEVDSTIGHGSTFIIYLPEIQFVKHDTKPEDTLTERRYDGEVLIMDDEEPIHNILKKMLERMGLRTTHTYSGEMAIEECQKSRYVLIILDLTVPNGLGGLEIVDKLRDLVGGTPIVVSSGYSKGLVLEDYKKYGFDDVLLKPYSYKELQALLQRQLSHL